MRSFRFVTHGGTKLICDFLMLNHVSGPTPNGDQWKATVLLVHGIDGNHKSTWANQGSPEEWYSELTSEFAGLSVVSADLDYSHARRFSSRENLIEHLSGRLLSEIAKARLFDRHLYVVAHSLGGILTKRLLTDSQLFDEAGYFEKRRINLKSIFFLGVPHIGSPWAQKRLAKVLGFARLRSTTSRDLAPGSRALEDINKKFVGSLNRFGRMEIHSIHETLPVRPKIGLGFVERRVHKILEDLGPVVPPDFARLGIESEQNLECQACHFSLPKFEFAGNEVLRERIRTSVRQSFEGGSGSRLSTLDLDLDCPL